MCGIIGICAKKNLGIQELPKLSNATSILKKSSPVNSSFQLYDKCGFGHTLLSISDPDVQSNQPFISQDTRYTLVFNVEIYNYRELKVEWENVYLRGKRLEFQQFQPMKKELETLSLKTKRGELWICLRLQLMPQACSI